MEKNQLAIVEINGTTILGTLKDNKIKGLVVRNGSVGHILDCFLKEKEQGRLQTTIIGDRKNVLISELTDEQKIELARLKSLMKVARKQVKSHVTSEPVPKPMTDEERLKHLLSHYNNDEEVDFISTEEDRRFSLIDGDGDITNEIRVLTDDEAKEMVKEYLVEDFSDYNYEVHKELEGYGMLQYFDINEWAEDSIASEIRACGHLGSFLNPYDGTAERITGTDLRIYLTG